MSLGGPPAFVYDPFGRRIKKSTSSTTAIYVYDGADQLQEVNSTGTTVNARYTLGPGIDQPLAEARGSTTSFYEADGLGSVTSLSKSTGTLVNTYTYDSFGKQTASSGTVVNNFRYTGRELDSETGLMYYRARYYDQNIGRFLSEDPAGLDGGINRYAYVLNDSINLFDPLGLDALTDDPAVRKCMCELWKSSGYGTAINESTAWVIFTTTRSCTKWPNSNEFSHQTWKGPLPANREGIIHTHPVHAHLRNPGIQDRSPEPSRGQPSDEQTAHDQNLPLYTISDRGVWKITPAGVISQEAGPELLDGFDKNCNCKPPKVKK